MSQFKDYYATLGVARDAGEADIKKAFRKLARKYHPDVSQEPDAAARMSEVNEAYAVLSDAERRAAYDRVGQGRQAGESFTPPPGWDTGFEFRGGPGAGAGGASAGGFGAGDFAGYDGFQGFEGGQFSDFFAELFGRGGVGAAGARAGRRAPGAGAGAGAGAWPGEDHHARVELDLEDAYRGATRQLTLQAVQQDDTGRVALVPRTLEVRIPKGVRPGQLIRLSGQGGPGQGGAKAGDLYLEVQFRPHPRFRVDGSDLVAELPVAPWEAALGAVVPVTLPDGSSLKVRVPKGAQSGRSLTVRGQGLPSATPGDLELVVRVVLPSAYDPRAQALYEQMAQALPDFDARKVAEAESQRAD